MPKFIKLYLIIYVLFSANLNAQNLEFKLIGKTEPETAILDSLNTISVFQDYQSLIKAIDSTLMTLQKIGYIESVASPLTRKNDSLFISEFDLKKKYNYHIYLLF